VRLVGPSGEQVGVVRVEDALRLAEEADLDLVEVAPDARPPVCKLMDYGKFKYESAMKARDARRNQANTQLKEIQFRPKIDEHDYATKRGHVERFLKGGDKVKCIVRFRGREQSRPELGIRLLQGLAAGMAEQSVARRAVQPFETTGELVAVIQKAVPAAAQRKGGHPAKRTFQALRIEVNHELEALERAVPVAIDSLSLGGRFVAMSYHSLEDKIVKRGLSAAATSKAPKGFPVELDEHKPTMKVITRGAEPPTEAEIAENSRAASAKLRAGEKIRVT